MIKATRTPHLSAPVKPSAGQHQRGHSIGPSVSMDCKQGTCGSCIYERCDHPHHAAEVYEDGKWRTLAA